MLRQAQLFKVKVFTHDGADSRYMFVVADGMEEALKVGRLQVRLPSEEVGGVNYVSEVYLGG